MLNLVNFRAYDHDELLGHNTTTWFSYKRDQKIETIETFRLEFNKELEESQPNFTKLLPIKVIMRMSNLTLSHLGDLIHSQPGGGRIPPRSITLLSLIQIKPNLVCL